MDGSVELRLKVPDDFDAVMAIALSLPEWFNDLDNEQVAVDLHRQRGTVAEVDGSVAAFVVWLSRVGLGEIGWNAVGSGCHQYGIGTCLLEFAEDSLCSRGVTEVHVDTLGGPVDNESQERTRVFYRRTASRDFKSVTTDNLGMPESLALRRALLQSPGAYDSPIGTLEA